MGVAGEKFKLGTVGALSLSVVSSVFIVICNKALVSALGFVLDKSILRLEANSEAALLDCCFKDESVAFAGGSDGCVIRGTILYSD
ncbi:hypothetical protein ZWY2020_003941 [Hordeum vulgare]|nr:hypothetical protein ZWY2020_003941 [Hordeum vulgare]